ncbi:hypothetical protein PUATCC27989T_02446 [Phytobacter ursingii]|nr:hypothetical protein PUATCC27989T_02446 [Phytobacter ursingii]
MLRYLLVVFIACLCSSNVFAINIKCSGGSPLESFTMPVQNLSVTSGGEGDTAAYSKLATWSFFRWSGNAQCDMSSAYSVNTIGYVVPYNGKQPTLYNGEWVFPTSEESVGISFKVAMGNAATPVNPVGTSANYTILNAGGMGTEYRWTSLSYNALSVQATLWKIPPSNGGTHLPINGLITFTGPVLNVLLNIPPGNTMLPPPPNNGYDADFPTGWLIMSKQFNGSLTAYPGTCNFMRKTVPMGSHDINNSLSDWKDATFTLQCPKAYGYNSTYSINSANAISGTTTITPNKGLVLTVMPRTSEVGTNNGVIALDSGSTATGFGIQLAWGTTSQSTGTTPVSPVKFNQPLDPGTIAATGYTTKTYSSSSTPTTETIKMAARYIRTTGAVSAGSANSSIEIVASYN